MLLLHEKAISQIQDLDKISDLEEKDWLGPL